jgi:low affinity Fe/Cu permease
LLEGNRMALAHDTATKIRVARPRKKQPAVARPNSSDGVRRRYGTFKRFAQATSHFVGTSVAFGIALLVVVVWAVTGPLFRYSDTWQLVINTGTTIVTFLMVFLIQHTQNRDSESLRLKLDELIRAVDQARDDFIEIDDLDDDELRALREEFQHLRERVTERRSRKSRDA